MIQKEDFKEFNTLLNNYYNNEKELEKIAKFIREKCFYNTTEKTLII